MERLTVPDTYIDGGKSRAIIDARAVREEAMTIYWALKRYEDTGLTPEEIIEKKVFQGWIPVEERLPDRETDVLVAVSYCPKFVKYKGCQVKECLKCNVAVYQDGYIACSLVDTLGCTECYKEFMESMEE